MGRTVSAKRKADSMELELWRSIKKSVKIVKGLASDNDFVDTFKYSFPNQWQNICDYHKKMERWNQNRKSKKLKPTYLFTSPEQFLRHKAEKVSATPLPQSANKKEIISSLSSDSLKKLRKRNFKKYVSELSKQHVEPSYASLHINAYYQIRKSHPLDIDARYLIIHELAKYKCGKTIEFLEKLVRCEKNMHLQHYAWECLNTIGVTGVHKGRRPGKKKISYIRAFTPISTPQDLLKAIYNSPLEQMKSYDLFLSHSYKDKVKLIELKDILNNFGINVYMDWANDKDELQRELTSAETAAVITERIKISKAILYIHTDSSFDSKWTPWELGYAYALKKPILVYKPEATNNDPEYLQLFQTVSLKDERMLVDGEKSQSIEEWLKQI